MSETEQEARTFDLKSWGFWRKRIGRALIVGALALTAAQILPALPEEQIVVVLPPAGSQLTRAQLTYFSKDDGEPLGGTELVPAGPAPRLTHTVDLPSGEYQVSLNAVGVNSAGEPQSYSSRKTIQLSGSTAQIRLQASSQPR